MADRTLTMKDGIIIFDKNNWFKVK
jgi:hypothetical protein